MSGKAGLTIVRPLPLIVAAVTTVFAVPGFEMRIVCVAVAPILTFPKKSAVGVAVNPPDPVVVVAPLPEMVRVAVGFAALELNDTVPVTLPLAVGVNVMESA